MPIRIKPINVTKAATFCFDNRPLPVTPHTLDIKNDNQNESTQSVDGTPITIPKRDKAQTFTLSFLFPFYVDHVQDEAWMDKYPAFKTVKELTDFLWIKKNEREPVTLTIIYPDLNYLNGDFLIDDYQYTQDATNGSDYDFDITLTEYYPANNYEVNGQLRNSLLEHGIRNPRRLD